MKREIRVLTYGTFDLFHVGHVRILKRAKELGDKLIVGLSTDEFNSIKGKQAIFSYGERKEILESCKYVDEVIPEKDWDQKIDDIKTHRIDLLVMGSDWEGSEKFEYLKDYVNVLYLPRTEEVSTTDLKSILHTQKD